MIGPSAQYGWSRMGYITCSTSPEVAISIQVLRSVVIELAKRYKPDVVLIEDASTGIALAQELRSTLHMAVEPVKIERDKRGRMYVQQAKFAAGLVRFPKDAPFMAELIRELLEFPQSKYDDQVDSISQALAYQFSGYTLDNVRG